MSLVEISVHLLVIGFPIVSDIKGHRNRASVGIDTVPEDSIIHWHHPVSEGVVKSEKN